MRHKRFGRSVAFETRSRRQGVGRVTGVTRGRFTHPDPSDGGGVRHHPRGNPMSLRHTLSLAAVLAVTTGLVHAAPAKDEPIQPIAPAKVKDAALVELGKKLYFDTRLSKSGFISCNSCHNLSMGGTDNLKTSIGHNWNKGPINAPTVLNSSMNLAQFWDGRAKDLNAQAGGPIANPGEMASNHALAVEMLQSIP